MHPAECVSDGVCGAAGQPGVSAAGSGHLLPAAAAPLRPQTPQPGPAGAQPVCEYLCPASIGWETGTARGLSLCATFEEWISACVCLSISHLFLYRIRLSVNENVVFNGIRM